MGNLYNYTGEEIHAEYRPIFFDENVKGIAHRGFSSVAPENTIPSYILASKMGFRYVETDVSFTSDGVPMLLHDDTIDRTSNGTGALSSMTYNQVRQYDFGSWKSSVYAGTQIPTLQEFLDVCRALMLHPYIEIKNNHTYTQQQIENIVNMVNASGLRGKATFMSFKYEYLEYIKGYDDEARLGYPAMTASTNDITTCQSLKTSKNEVFYDPPYESVTNSICTVFMESNIPIEVWTIDSVQTILSLNKYISAVTSNSLHAGRVIYDSVNPIA